MSARARARLFNTVSQPGSGNTVTANLVLSRTSGTTPAHFLVDATGTTTNVAKANQAANGNAFRQLYYSFSVSNMPGNWTQLGGAKNARAGGPLAAFLADNGTNSHVVTLTVTVGNPWRTNTAAANSVYEVDAIVTQGGNTYYCATAHTAGTFATDLSGGKWVLLQTGLIQDSTTATFTATSANTTYSGTNTVYVSPSSTFAGAAAYSGCATATSIGTPANNKRYVLHGGESYGDVDLSGRTNCQVVWDGNSTQPALGRCNINGTNNAFVGISASLGISGFTGTYQLAYGCNIQHSDLHAATAYFSNDFNSDFYSQCQYMGLFSNTVPANATSDASIYGGGLSLMIVDNYAAGTVQHTVRICAAWKSVVLANKFDGPVIDGSKQCFKLHAQGPTPYTNPASVQWPTTSSTGKYATEYVVVAENQFGHSSATNAWICDTCPENFDDTTIEKMSDILYENNTVVPSGTTTNHYVVAGRRITQRNNACTSGSWTYGDVSNASGADNNTDGNSLIGSAGVNGADWRANWLYPLLRG